VRLFGSILQEILALPVDPDPQHAPRQTMGFERPMNLLWLLLLFAATWAFWSLRAALVLLVLLIAATLIGMRIRRKQS
jgi:hypothetical protein